VNAAPRFAAAGAGRCTPLLLGVVLVAAIGGLRPEIAALPATLAQLRLWGDSAAQRRASLGVAYDFLRAAERLLPARATVLLLTPGRDLRHREYRLYHRALYQLTPRPLWWLTPAPPDGTWESRWWISTPLSAAAIRGIARRRGATHVLAFDLETLPRLGGSVTALPGGALVALGAATPAPGDAQAAPLDELSRAWPLRLAGALLVLFLIGDLVVSVVGSAPRGAERVALAWVLGAGGTAVAMLWLNAAGLHLDGQVKSVTGLAVAGLAGRHAGRGRRSRARAGVGAPPEGQSNHHSLRLLSVACWPLLAGCVALAGVYAVGRPLTAWDAWVLWGMRSRTIFVENGISAAIYADPSRAVTLLDYPLLVPSLQAWIYVWLGSADDRFAGLVPLLFFAALPVLARAALLRRGADSGLALVAATAIAANPSLLRLTGDGFADVVVAAFATAAAIHLVDWLEGRGATALLVAAIAAGLAAYTKREGVVLVVALAIAVLGTGRGRSRARKGALALLAATSVLSLPWMLFAALHAGAGLPFEAITPSLFVARLGRFPSIARQALEALCSPRGALLWPAAALCALCRPRSSSLAPALLPLAALLYLGALSMSYFFSAYAPYQQHMASSYYRLVAQVSPLVVLWIAAAANPRLRCNATPC
jgi:hypothetical protein